MELNIQLYQFLKPLLTWATSCTRAVRVPSYQ